MADPILIEMTGEPLNFHESCAHLVTELTKRGTPDNKHTSDVTFRLVHDESVTELTYRMRFLKVKKEMIPKGASRPKAAPDDAPVGEAKK